MSSTIEENNRRIAKNTMALYFRTFITMIVGLYTSRVMLKALGVDNYGINNVVGGIVSMSSLVTGTMSQAISRYLTFTLGQGDKQRMRLMFSTSINAQIILSVIAVVLLEIFGLWFLNSGANIPEGRMVAANWVFQCSLISLVIGLISSPFNALLVAHERMNIYAYTSISDVVLKLGICFAIVTYGGDRLILMAILNVLVGVVMFLFYRWYGRYNFEEARYNVKSFDKGLLKELSVFSGWNLLNNGAYVFATQGVNMLINVFFGVAYNAARAIAQSVNSAVQSFVTSFTTAFSPQITKSYAAGDKNYAVQLGNRGTKFAWLMTYIFIVPVVCEAETLLKLWLGDVPEWSVIFLRFTMFESLAVISGQNLFRLIQADGNVKNYTIHAAITAGMIFPLVWIAYILNAPVWVSYIIFIIDFLMLNLVRFYDIKKLMIFSVRQHFRDVIWPCLWVSVLSFMLPIIVCYLMKPGIIRFVVNVPVAVLWTGLCCIIFGLTNGERAFFWNKAKQFLKLKSCD